MASALLPQNVKLKDYVIIRALGHGSFGNTYLARDVRNQSEVVIKEHFPVELCRRAADYSVVPTGNPQSREKGSYFWSLTRFREEVMRLRRLSHPGIVPVFDTFSVLNTTYMVMPVAGRQSLLELRKDSGRPRPHALHAMLLRLLSALEYLHGRKEIHRDIKPANIMINDEGDPVIVDFGSARSFGSNGAAPAPMTMLVSQGFSPPEQYRTDGGEAGPWTDLYSLGATFYYMIKGTPPPVNFALGAAPPQPPLAQDAEAVRVYGAELLATIDKALAYEPSKRWKSAGEWSKALGALVVPLGEDDVPTSLTGCTPGVVLPPGAGSGGSQGPKEDKPRPRWVLPVVIVLALLLLGGGGWFGYTLLDRGMGGSNYFYVEGCDAFAARDWNRCVKSLTRSQEEKEALSDEESRDREEKLRLAYNKLRAIGQGTPAPTIGQEPYTADLPEVTVQAPADTPAPSESVLPVDRPDAPAPPAADGNMGSLVPPPLPVDPQGAPKDYEWPQRAILMESSACYTDEAGTQPADNCPEYFSVVTVVKGQPAGMPMVQVECADGRRLWVPQEKLQLLAHNLSVQFTQLSQRRRSLFFQDEARLGEYLSLPASERLALADASIVGDGDRAREAGVVALEPALWADYRNDFFALPVVDYKMMPGSGDGLDVHRAINVVALTPPEAETEPGPEPPPREEVTQKAEYNVDIVFVMDLTRSMNPFCEAVRNFMLNVSKDLGTKLKDRVRFGFVGYRDGAVESEWAVYNHTANGLLKADSFAELLLEKEKVKGEELYRIRASSEDSIDFAEDMFAGLQEAVEQTPWSENSLHFVVLIGDAPGREGKEGLDWGDTLTKGYRGDAPKGSLSGWTLKEAIARLSNPSTGKRREGEEGRDDASCIYLQSIFIDYARYRQQRDRSQSRFGDSINQGELQFRALSNWIYNEDAPVVGGPLKAEDSPCNFTLVEGEDDFDKMFGIFNNMVLCFSEMPPDEALAQNEESPLLKGKSVNSPEMQARRLFQAAMLEWVSRQKKAGVSAGMNGWTTDRDAAGKVAMKPSVILTRDQLDTLCKCLSGILELENTGDTGDTMAQAGALSMLATKDPGKMSGGDAELLSSQMDAMKEVLAQLPYRSHLMSYEVQDLMALEGDSRLKLVEDLERCLAELRRISGDNTFWHSPDGISQESSKQVALIPLDVIP